MFVPPVIPWPGRPRGSPDASCGRNSAAGWALDKGLGFRVLGFRVLGFGVLGFGVLGFGVWGLAVGGVHGYFLTFFIIRVAKVGSYYYFGSNNFRPIPTWQRKNMNRLCSAGLVANNKPLTHLTAFSPHSAILYWREYFLSAGERVD